LPIGKSLPAKQILYRPSNAHGHRPQIPIDLPRVSNNGKADRPMPKIGPFEYPNHDIDTVVELIEETGERIQVQAETVSEETFQEDYIDRSGGTYNRYRYSLQLYGFIGREYGSDEIQINDSFVDIADPLNPEDKENAIYQSVRNVSIFVDLFSADFGPDFSSRQLRKWLIEDKSVPRKKVEPDDIEDLREKYAVAHEYLRESSEDAEDEVKDETETQEGQTKLVEPEENNNNTPDTEETTVPTQNTELRGEEEIEEFRIGNKAVYLPKENIEKEWNLLRATVDAYIEQLGEVDD
jgi:hypothetical protein